MEEFDAQEYLQKSPEGLPLTDIRPRYRRLRMREQALIIASEDLCPLLEKNGLIHESRTVQKRVDSLLTPITNIKLTYRDVVSTISNSIRQDPDVESLHLGATPTNQNTSPGIWSSPGKHCLTTKYCVFFHQ